MTKEEASAIVQKAVDSLSEHFDAVQILVTFNEESESRCFKKGVGNWYARQGMAHEFINEDLSRIHHQVKKEEFGHDE